MKKHLEQINKLKRHQAHQVLHEVSKKHKISRKTLFYIKEYGPHSNIVKRIVKESLKILIFASILSSLGGIALEKVKDIVVMVLPMIILLPSLNDLIGDYGTIVSTKLSTMLHEGQIKKKWWKSKELQILYIQLIIIALFTGFVSAILAILISTAKNTIDIELVKKIIFIATFDVFLLVNILFLISIVAGIHFYKKKEDPNNFLIPISTSIADLGNMIVLSLLVIYFFR